MPVETENSQGKTAYDADTKGYSVQGAQSSISEGTSSTSPLNASSLSSVAAVSAINKLRAEAERKTAPEWCITTPSHAHAMAQLVTTLIATELANAGPLRPQMISYFLDNSDVQPNLREIFENIRGLSEIRDFFIHHLSRDRSAIGRLDIENNLHRGDYKEAIEGIRVLIAEDTFFEMRKSITIPFVDSVEKEKKNQKLILNTLNSIEGREHPLPTEDHFTTMALGTNRVLRNRPIIGPDIWGSGDIRPPSGECDTHPVLSIATSTDRRIEGFSFRYSFFETRPEFQEPGNGSEGAYKVIYPLISLDERVLNALIDCINNPSSSTKEVSSDSTQTSAELSNSILKGIRDLSTLGGHDTWHHLFYGVNGDSSNRFTFTSSDAYFQSHTNIRDGDAFNLMRYQMPGPFGAFENHAYLSHRAIWNEIIESKENIANGVIRRFGNYLSDLSEIQPHLALRHGEDTANRMIKYLTLVAYDQVALLMPHSKIESNQTTNRLGDTLDQAINKLGFPPFRFVNEKMSQVLMSTFSEKDLAFETLEGYLTSRADSHVAPVLIEHLSLFFHYPIRNGKQYEDLAPLLSLLVLLDTSHDPNTALHISSLVHEVRGIEKSATREQHRLQDAFKTIAVEVLNLPAEQLPTLTISARSGFLFQQLAKRCATDPIRVSFFGSIINREDTALTMLCSDLRDEDIIINAGISLWSKQENLPGNNIKKYLTDRAIELYLHAENNRVSGIRGLVAERFDFSPNRRTWIDAYQNAFDPIRNLFSFEQGLHNSEALQSQDWSELKQKFDSARELIDNGLIKQNA